MLSPRFSICIPHWQARSLASACLRSIRLHAPADETEVIVVDNGSRDESLAWLRSLPWIRLIERPEESPRNWPLNVFTAWDVGLRIARGEFFVTMHTDVFLKRADWPDLFLGRFHNPKVAAVGSWKLDLESPWYRWQKQLVGDVVRWCKRGLGRAGKPDHAARLYPRDYFAMYRTGLLRELDLTFRPIHGQGGGYSIAKQIWDSGYETDLIPVPALAARMVHVAHGSAAVTSKTLAHARAQRKVERRVARLFREPWVVRLLNDAQLDAPAGSARAA